MRLPKLAIILLVALLAAGCVAPFTVHRLSPREAQLALTGNVLTTGKLSGFSEIVLRKYDLLGSYEEDPETALATLRAGAIAKPGAEDELFALAELSYLHAEQTAARCSQRGHYLAAALYAYALLFPGPGIATLQPIDPRTRIAADIYNRALAEAFETKDGNDVVPTSGVYELPFGRIEVAFDSETLNWGQGRFTDFMPSADFAVTGLINRYRKAGIGTPLAPRIDAPKDSLLAKFVSPNLRIPSTAVLRVDHPRQQLQTDYVRSRMDVYYFSNDASITIDGRDVPLESEPSAAYAAFLADSKFWEGELANFLGRTLNVTRPSVLTGLEPNRGRIPVVFVHGTNSSPARWADMVNDLLNDPEIHSRYNFFFFSYMSSNPIAYSARNLRNALTEVTYLLDPSAQDPCAKDMVVIGHSQGGLLTKMTAISSGDKFWREMSSKPFDQVKIPDATRQLLQESLFIEPLPFVKRVIFIATPHRGSFLAGPQFVRRLIERLVTLPVDILRMSADLTGALVGYESDTATLSLQRIPTAVDNMSPGHPFVRALADIPIAPGIAVNSIIPVKPEYDPYQDGNDGVVKYRSAHIEPVESELLVRSTHSTQSNPYTIAEVRRILLKHAAEMNCAPPIKMTVSPGPTAKALQH